MKKCLKCETEKEPSEFYANKRTKDRLHPYCKKCVGAYLKDWRTGKPSARPRGRPRKTRIEVEQKACTKCGCTKPVAEFDASSRSTDGYVGICKSCRNSVSDASSTVRSSEKRCSKCKVVKPIAEFHNSKRSPDGHDGRCKPCRNAARGNHRGKRGKRTVAQRRASWLRRKYNMTVEEYGWMLRLQGGVCQLCGKADEKRPLVVDHCHKGGQVRGLLCNRCNRLLGQANDDPAFLRRCAAYIEAGHTISTPRKTA